MTISRFVTAAALSVMAGCSAGPGAPAGGASADAAAANDAANHFTLRHPGGRGVDVLVGERSITGPSVSLTRYTDPTDHAIRGQAFTRSINVDVTADGVKGLDDGQPFNLTVKLEGGTLVVRGLIRGQITDYVLGPAGLRGSVGSCMYVMKREGAGYVGTRGCNTGAQIASMSFPASFGKWSTQEMAAALTVLLSAGLH